MMQNLGFALNSAWQVLVVSLLLGAGLPVLFAFAIRALSWGTAHGVDGDGRPHPAGRVIAYALFALVVLFVLAGVAVIVSSGFGMKVDFSHGFPTLVSKSH